MLKNVSLFLVLFLYTSVFSVLTKEVNTNIRLEQIEKELVETKSSLVEILKTVSIISKEFVHKDQIEKLISENNMLDIKFMSLNKQINRSQKQLTNYVHAAVNSQEKQFSTLKEDLSKLDKEVKGDHEKKFVTEDKFQAVSEQVEKLQKHPLNISWNVNALTENTIIRKEFSKFQVTVARDTARVKVKFIKIHAANNKNWRSLKGRKTQNGAVLLRF